MRKRGGGCVKLGIASRRAVRKVRAAHRQWTGAYVGGKDRIAGQGTRAAAGQGARCHRHLGARLGDRAALEVELQGRLGVVAWRAVTRGVKYGIRS